MIRRKLGVAALVVSSLFGLSTVVMARDRVEYRDFNRGYDNGLSSHERHEIEERRAREAREASRLAEMERRRAVINNNYYGRSSAGNAYYDRSGHWHPYGW